MPRPVTRSTGQPADLPLVHLVLVARLPIAPSSVAVDAARDRDEAP